MHLHSTNSTTHSIGISSLLHYYYYTSELRIITPRIRKDNETRQTFPFHSTIYSNSEKLYQFSETLWPFPGQTDRHSVTWTHIWSYAEQDFAELHYFTNDHNNNWTIIALNYLFVVCRSFDPVLCLSCHSISVRILAEITNQQPHWQRKGLSIAVGVEFQGSVSPCTYSLHCQTRKYDSNMFPLSDGDVVNYALSQ